MDRKERFICRIEICWPSSPWPWRPRWNWRGPMLRSPWRWGSTHSVAFWMNSSNITRKRKRSKTRRWTTRIRSKRRPKKMSMWVVGENSDENFDCMYIGKINHYQILYLEIKYKFKDWLEYFSSRSTVLLYILLRTYFVWTCVYTCKW